MRTNPTSSKTVYYPPYHLSHETFKIQPKIIELQPGEVLVKFDDTVWRNTANTELFVQHLRWEKVAAHYGI